MEVYFPTFPVKEPSGEEQIKMAHICDLGVARRIIDFVKHRQLPDSVLLASTTGSGVIFGQVMKSRPGHNYPFIRRKNHIYLGTLIKRSGKVVESFGEANQPEVVPCNLCNISIEILNRLIVNANKEYDHGARAFLRQDEGKYLRYNLYYQY